MFLRPRAISAVTAALLFSGAAAVVGCSQNTLDLLGRSFVPVDIAQTSIIENTYERVMLPGYKHFSALALELDDAVQAWANNPQSESLKMRTQQAWKKASSAWVETEAYQFGPATEQRLRQNIAFWPRRLSHIQEVLADTESVQIQKLGASRKGLPAMEYVIFEQSALFQSGEAGQKARNYLKVLSADLVLQANALQSEWQDTYAKSFLESANAQNMQLNQWVVLLENTKNKRLGEPAGLLGTALGAEALEAPDSDYSLSLIRAALDGFAESYQLQRANATGTSGYLIALGHRQVDQKINEQLKKVYTSLNRLEPSLEQSLKENPEAVSVSYEEIKTLLRYVKVDLANALNQTVNFTDNDGD